MQEVYCGSDSDLSISSTEPIEFYWINLDFVCFVHEKDDKLTLKMLDESVFVIQGEDVNQVKALLFSQVVNCDKEWDESETINSEFPPDAWDPLKIDLRDDDIPI